MTSNEPRCDEARVVIQFAPIRRASEDHGGPPDLHTCAYQTNMFRRFWSDDSRTLSFHELRETFVHEWCDFVAELRSWFDAVVAVQAEFGVCYQIPIDCFRADETLALALDSGATFRLRLRHASPPLGTVFVNIAAGNAPGALEVRLLMLGHPGTPLAAELASWLDKAHNELMRELKSMLITQPAGL